jgi:hypothetical protein
MVIVPPTLRPAPAAPAVIAVMFTVIPPPVFKTARAVAFVDDIVGDVLIGILREAVATNESVVLYLFATNAVAPEDPKAAE